VKLTLDEMRKKTRGGSCQVRSHVHFDSISSKILETIREVEASMIITGTRRVSYFRGALGSTTEEAVRKCPIPVLIVPC